MKLAASLLILALVSLAVVVWDLSTLSWVPHTMLYFIDVPQFLYVLLPALAVTVIVHSGPVLLSGAGLALGLLQGADKESVVKGGRAIQFMGQVAVWLGGMITLIESVISAQNAATISALLPALGVSALGVTYGLAIRIACGFGVQIIKVRLGPFVFYTE